MNQQKKRGFAALSPERLREITSMGGRAVPARKRAFSKNRTLAQKAGRKGGMSTLPEKRSYSQDRELARRSGSKGGKSVAPENRSFSRDPELAARAGRKGGSQPRSKPSEPISAGPPGE